MQGGACLAGINNPLGARALYLPPKWPITLLSDTWNNWSRGPFGQKTYPSGLRAALINAAGRSFMNASESAPKGKLQYEFLMTQYSTQRHPGAPFCVGSASILALRFAGLYKQATQMISVGAIL